MSRRSPSFTAVWIFLLAALACATHAAEDTHPAEHSAEEIAKLVEGLKSPDFDVRLKFKQELRALGTRAHPALEQALKGELEPEVRDALRELLKELGNCSLTVEVYDRFGNPAAGVKFKITLQPAAEGHDEEKILRELQTDAHGIAVVEGLQTGAYWCHKPECLNTFASMRFEPARKLTLEPGSNHLRLWVELPATVSGVVLDAATGKPIKDAEVALLKDIGLDLRGLELSHPDGMGNTEHLGTATEWQKTDADGKFAISKVQRGQHILFCRHPAYFCEPFSIGYVTDRQALKLPDAVRVQPRSAVCGTARLHVTGPDGQPLKSAAVQVLARRQRTPEEEQGWINNREFRLLSGRHMQSKFGFYNGWSAAETNKDGTVELTGLQPGEYEFSVLQSGFAASPTQQARIQAKGTADLNFAAPTVGGGMEGVLRDASGKPVEYGEVFLVKESDPEFQTRHKEPLPSWLRLQDVASAGPQWFAALQEEGKFSFTHIVPGRYALWCGAEVGWTDVIEVAEGKTSTFESKNPAPTAIKTPPQQRKISGKVVTADGEPCAHAEFAFVYHGGARGSEANEKGEFSAKFTPTEDMVNGLRLQFFHSGFQPADMDITTPGMDLEHLTIVMQKQRYGDLQVTVTDAEGHPLPDCVVSVTPPEKIFLGKDVPAVTGKTDANGKVALNRIAVGKRTLTLQKPNYFVETNPEVVVSGEPAQSVKFEMLSALSISGSVTGIPKEEWKNVRVILNPSQGHSAEEQQCSLDADGHFSLHGLKPGLYVIRPEAPGWIETDVTPLGLHRDIKDLVLTMCRPGYLNLNLGPSYRGYDALLSEPGQWNPFNVKPRTGPDRVSAYEMREMRANSYREFRCDNQGRADAFGIKPGTYDLLLKPYEDMMGYERQDLHAQLVCKNVSVPTFEPGTPNPMGFPALTPAVRAGTGTITGLVRWKDPKAKDYKDVYDDLDLYIVGQDAVGRFSYRLDHLLEAIGAPPGSPKSEVNRFKLHGLPPGEYQIAWRFNVLDEELSYIRIQVPKARWTDSELPLVLLKTVKLGEGENLDVGEFTYEPDELVRKLLIWDHERDHPPFEPPIGDDAPRFRP